MHPIREPHQSGMLAVSERHRIYWEESGNPAGIPVIYLHGGPGASTAPACRGFFNPEKYRIVLIDQRGSGRSEPYADIEENTTWDLVADIEKVREMLGIDKWLVFGGSWGSTLALAYAQSHPEAVLGLILRGIFLCRQSEIDWLCQSGGSNRIYPDVWQDFLAPVPADERGDLVEAYRRLLSPDNPDREQMLAAASAWARQESHIICLEHDQKGVDYYNDGMAALAISRIENHYFVHRGWLDGEKAILNNIDKIRHIPTRIVQGRYDICTPPASAWDLQQAFPEAKLEWTLAGHTAFEPATAKALVAATDYFAEHGTL